MMLPSRSPFIENRALVQPRGRPLGVTGAVTADGSGGRVLANHKPVGPPSSALGLKAGNRRTGARPPQWIAQQELSILHGVE